MIKVKRVYAPVEEGDGTRFLVDRLWPRGLKKEALRMAGWLKDAAPSDSLRRWVHRDPEKWDEFRTRYTDELRKNLDALEPLMDAARRGDVTLLYSAHDTEHNNAFVLKSFLKALLMKPDRRRRAHAGVRA